MRMNQELEESFDMVSLYLAILYKMFSGSLDIIVNNDSCFKCNRAEAGKDPERKWTTEFGVFWCSLRRFWSLFFKWLSRRYSSVAFRTSADVPDNKTGIP